MDHISDPLPGKEGRPNGGRQDGPGRLEWMLTSPYEAVNKDLLIECAPPLGQDSTGLRLIIDSVGKDVLERILVDTLALLGTSAAVYEKDGTCSMGVFSSSWCRFQDSTFRKVGETTNLEQGGYLCHHSCWSESTQLIEEVNGPVDRPCPGGLRIYAVPILARGEIIGSINIG
jgi:hypothetical protein